MIKVLIAEDMDILREDTQEMVDSFCDTKVVAEAASGKKAVEVFRNTDVDVVLMDIEMESMDAGIKAAETMLSIKSDVSIIYLTSHDSDKMVILAMATGAKDFVVKGSSAEILHEHILNAYYNKVNLDARIQNILMRDYKRLRQNEDNLLFFIKKVGSLTPAEKELVACFLSDMKVKDIADRRCVEPVTVKSQVRTLLQKFGCGRTKEIVNMIRTLGLEHLFENR